MSNSAARVGHRDIFTQALQYADDRTLSRAMRLSWAHFDLAGQLLYEHLTIDPNEADSLFRGASSGALILYDGTERELKKSLFDYVKRIDLLGHNCNSWGSTACSRWREANINFPNLQTVRRWKGGWWACTWEQRLTPRKILCIGMHCPHSVEIQDCIRHPSLHLVTHITLVIDQLADNTKENRKLLRSSRKTPVPSVKLHKDLEVVVIFRTGHGTRPVPSTSPPQLVGSVSLENLVDQLAILALTPVKRLEICNADEYLAAQPSPQDNLDAETRVKRRIEEVTRRRGEVKLLAARLDQLCFTTRETDGIP